MAVDGSVTPVNFDLVAANDIYIYRVCLSIVDAIITPTKFGGIVALTNGLQVLVVDVDGSTILDFLDGRSIKKNADWSLLLGVDAPTIAAAGEDHLPGRWTIANAAGGDSLKLTTGQRLRYRVRDDLSGVTEFTALVQGVT